MPLTRPFLLCVCLLAACGRPERPASDEPGPMASPTRPNADPPAAAPTLRAVPRERVAEHEPAPPTSVTRVKAEGQLGPGRGTLLIDLKPPDGGKLTEGAPLRVTARGKDLAFPQTIRTVLDPDQLPVKLPIDVSDGASEPADIDLTYYWCSEGETGSCHPVRVRLVVELDLSGAGAGGEAHLVHRPPES